MMITNGQTTKQLSQTIPCPVCGDPLSFQIAKGRKSGKPFLMWKCLRDGRHYRGFIGDRKYIREVIDRLEVSHQGTGSQGK